jgi:glucose-6-phosphate-specific signal transduction histidine kinase
MNHALPAPGTLGGWGGAVLALLVQCIALPVLAEEFTGIVHPQRDLTLSLGVGGVVAKVEEIGRASCRERVS